MRRIFFAPLPSTFEVKYLNSHLLGEFARIASVQLLDANGKEVVFAQTFSYDTGEIKIVPLKHAWGLHLLIVNSDGLWFTQKLMLE